MKARAGLGYTARPGFALIRTILQATFHCPVNPDSMTQPTDTATPPNHRSDLEDSFFSGARDGLRERLREVADTRVEQMESLAKISGIADIELLEKLVVLGIDQETLAALTLYPLVAVAWADGVVDRRERETVLKAAVECGLERGGVSHDLLEDWLEHAPEPLLLRAWQGFVRELAQQVTPDFRATFERELLRRARAVANATGGFLALDKTSSSEQRVLEQLRKSFI